MNTIKRLFLTSTLFIGLIAPAWSQDNTPLLRWGNEQVKTEPGTTDAMKKLNAEFAEMKSRLQQLDEYHAKHSSSMKAQFQTMQDMLNSMQASCDRLNHDIAAARNNSGVSQASATVPATRKPIEDGGKPDLASSDMIMKRLDELAAALQTNTRELVEMKKQYDAHQLEFLQAQNDIGKLQQDMVKLGTRAQADAGGSNPRSSLSMPLPPDSQSNTANKPAVPAATQGTLKLVNNYPLSVSVIVDSQLYTLRPNDTLSLNRNPGYVTYEVVGIQGNTLRTINAAETLTVQIVPR